MLKDYLMDKLVNDRHPETDRQSCVNRRQHRLECSLCTQICPVQIQPNAANGDFTLCDDCGLCVAQCPAGCIAGSSIYIQNLLGLLELSEKSIVLGCSKADVPAHGKLPCLGSIPWEILGVLALRGTVSFVHGDCTECIYKLGYVCFQRGLERLRSFLGEQTYHAALSEEMSAPSHSRREAFAAVFRKGKRSAAAILPKALQESGSGSFFRKLLLREALALDSDASPVHWTTPLFNEQCHACGICAKVCPVNALRVLTDGEVTTFYMSHDGWKCTACGVCKAVCPYEGIADIVWAKAPHPAQPFLTKAAALPCSRCGKPAPDTDGICPSCKAQANRSQGVHLA